MAARILRRRGGGSGVALRRTTQGRVRATVGVMLARLRTNPMDALIALAIAVVLVLEIVLGGEPGAGAASLVAALAISVPLAWGGPPPPQGGVGYAGGGPPHRRPGGGLFSGA